MAAYLRIGAAGEPSTQHESHEGAANMQKFRGGFIRISSTVFRVRVHLMKQLIVNVLPLWTAYNYLLIFSG